MKSRVMPSRSKRSRKSGSGRGNTSLRRRPNYPNGYLSSPGQRPLTIPSMRSRLWDRSPRRRPKSFKSRSSVRKLPATMSSYFIRPKRRPKSMNMRSTVVRRDPKTIGSKWNKSSVGHHSNPYLGSRRRRKPKRFGSSIMRRMPGTIGSSISMPSRRRSRSQKSGSRGYHSSQLPLVSRRRTRSRRSTLF